MSVDTLHVELPLHMRICICVCVCLDFMFLYIVARTESNLWAMF